MKDEHFSGFITILDQVIYGLYINDIYTHSTSTDIFDYTSSPVESVYLLY